MSDIKVWVVDYGRKYLVLQWIDPVTGKRCSRSSRCTRRRDADRAAAKLEDELRSAVPLGDGSISWGAFVDSYQNEYVAGTKPTTQNKTLGVLSVFGRTVSPKSLGHVTTSAVSDYVVALRAEGRQEATIGGHLSVIHAALNWAKDQGHIRDVPRMPKLPRNPAGRLMKGRPPTGPEFVKMLRATRTVVGVQNARSWRHFLRGLWLSGLRLDESLRLTWDDPSQLMIDLSTLRPQMWIPAEYDKGFRDRRMPLTPDFAKWVMRTRDRTGFVFQPIGDRGRRVFGLDHVGRVISEIGETAGVLVNPRLGKFASSHDLRRAFGTRWARRVPPKILQELMRHADISTTMSFYVELDTDETAEDLWKQFG